MAKTVRQTLLFGDLRNARQLPKSCSTCHECDKTLAVLPNAIAEPAYTEATVVVGNERRDLYWCKACTDNTEVDIHEDGASMHYDPIGKIVRSTTTVHRRKKPRRYHNTLIASLPENQLRLPAISNY